MPSIALSKGALIRLGAPGPSPRTIAFQYNPASLQHFLHAGTWADAPAGSGTSGGVGTIVGGSASASLSGASSKISSSPPIKSVAEVSEVYRFTLVLDAADAMQTPTPGSVAHPTGVHPMLAALELLLREDAAPPNNSATVFVWGVNRKLPVRVVGLDVSEELFDPALNPLHATVCVTLQALDGTEPGASRLAATLFAQHQAALAVLAASVYTASMAPSGTAPAG